MKTNEIIKQQSLAFQFFLNLIQNHILYENLKIKYKPILLSFFVKKGFTITLGKTVYIDKNTKLSIATLFHEVQHMLDQRTYSKKTNSYKSDFLKMINFYIKYTFPQNLLSISLLSILAIWFSKLFLLFLIFIIFSIPMPFLTKNRKDYELRGYFWSWLIGKRTRFADVFCTSKYYFMDTAHSDRYYQQIFKNYQLIIMSSNQYPCMKKLYELYIYNRN